MSTEANHTNDVAPSTSVPAEYFTFLLEQLVSLPLNTSADAKHWDDACAAIRAEMHSKFPQFNLNDDLRALLTVPTLASDLITRQQKQAAIYNHIIFNRRETKPKAIELKSSFGRVIITVAIPIISFFVALPISMRIGGHESDWLGLGIIFRAGLIFLSGCVLALVFWSATREDSGSDSTDRL